MKSQFWAMFALVAFSLFTRAQAQGGHPVQTETECYQHSYAFCDGSRGTPRFGECVRTEFANCVAMVRRGASERRETPIAPTPSAPATRETATAQPVPTPAPRVTAPVPSAPVIPMPPPMPPSGGMMGFGMMGGMPGGGTVLPPVVPSQVLNAGILVPWSVFTPGGFQGMRFCGAPAGSRSGTLETLTRWQTLVATQGQFEATPMVMHGTVPSRDGYYTVYLTTRAAEAVVLNMSYTTTINGREMQIMQEIVPVQSNAFMFMNNTSNRGDTCLRGAIPPNSTVTVLIPVEGIADRNGVTVFGNRWSVSNGAMVSFLRESTVRFYGSRGADTLLP